MLWQKQVSVTGVKELAFKFQFHHLLCYMTLGKLQKLTSQHFLINKTEIKMVIYYTWGVWELNETMCCVNHSLCTPLFQLLKLKHLLNSYYINPRHHTRVPSSYRDEDADVWANSFVLFSTTFMILIGRLITTRLYSGSPIKINFSNNHHPTNDCQLYVCARSFQEMYLVT